MSVKRHDYPPKWQALSRLTFARIRRPEIAVKKNLHNLQFLQRPDPFAPFTPDPHCPDRLARTALAVDLPRRWRVIPADRSDFARSGLPMAVNQREQHAALETTPAEPGLGEIYKRRGISIFHCGFGISSIHAVPPTGFKGHNSRTRI